MTRSTGPDLPEIPECVTPVLPAHFSYTHGLWSGFD
jgi:hypothetical protein